MAAVEVYVFHCGQGDTLLLRLDGSKWILLDCNLPGKAADEFIARLEALGIHRLDLICLSHPDRDHYTGMERVLEYFTEAPRQVGTFCDAGFAAKLARVGSSVRLDREIVSLYRRVLQLVRSNQITYLQVAAHHNIESEAATWPAQISVLSPLGSQVQLANLEALIEDQHPAANEYSLVLIISSGDPSTNFLGLLPGDANGQTLTEALARMPKTDNRSFDFVKVSHHGSLHSHRGSPVCDRIREPDVSAAVISSSGKSRVLPRREVIAEYLRSGWRLYDTGRRQEPTLGATFLSLVAWPESVGGAYNIVVRWTPEEGLTVIPPEAAVTPDQIRFYAGVGI